MPCSTLSLKNSQNSNLKLSHFQNNHIYHFLSLATFKYIKVISFLIHIQRNFSQENLFFLSIKIVTLTDGHV